MKNLSKKLTNQIKNNMVSIGSDLALGYLNDSGDLHSVVYTPSRAETLAQFKAIQNDPKWNAFAIDLKCG